MFSSQFLSFSTHTTYTKITINVRKIADMTIISVGVRLFNLRKL